MSSFSRENDCRRPICCSPTPRFIQVILDDTSRDVKLGIPKKFVNEYGQCLSNSVCLKLPSGSEWEVEVTRSNGKVWFEKCWPEFSKFYSLSIGDFLVFEYEGDSEFHVFIFDISTTEIDYPIKRPKMEEAPEDEFSVEILEDIPPSPKTREKTPLPCRQSYKKMKTSLTGKTDQMFENENTEPFENPKKNKDSHCSASKIKSMEHKFKKYFL
ncbi:putative transcription factor B3-Domain family [Rosa chinensis]|uniref:Putative transcription factor B3-Domain family n=1 Tax=Rosa chinensis TaxID=74649 RepID=A0A2P6RMX3_ROSCH|nr:putative transcription factor B3-Domain family [Rosa chinensis]